LGKKVTELEKALANPKTKKQRKHRTLLMTIITPFLLVACGGGSSKVDEFLDSYESSIEGFEDMANKGSVSLSDINKMNQNSLELTEQVNDLKEAEEWTDSQTSRYLKLTSRFSEAMTEMSKSMQP